MTGTTNLLFVMNLTNDSELIQTCGARKVQEANEHKGESITGQRARTRFFFKNYCWFISGELETISTAT